MNNLIFIINKSILSFFLILNFLFFSCNTLKSKSLRYKNFIVKLKSNLKKEKKFSDTNGQVLLLNYIEENSNLQKLIKKDHLRKINNLLNDRTFMDSPLRDLFNKTFIEEYLKENIYSKLAKDVASSFISLIIDKKLKEELKDLIEPDFIEKRIQSIVNHIVSDYIREMKINNIDLGLVKLIQKYFFNYDVSLFFKNSEGPNPCNNLKYYFNKIRILDTNNSHRKMYEDLAAIFNFQKNQKFAILKNYLFCIDCPAPESNKSYFLTDRFIKYVFDSKTFVSDNNDTRKIYINFNSKEKPLIGTLEVGKSVSNFGFSKFVYNSFNLIDDKEKKDIINQKKITKICTPYSKICTPIFYKNWEIISKYSQLNKHLKPLKTLIKNKGALFFPYYKCKDRVGILSFVVVTNGFLKASNNDWIYNIEVNEEKKRYEIQNVWKKTDKNITKLLSMCSFFLFMNNNFKVDKITYDVKKNKFLINTSIFCNFENQRNYAVFIQ